MEKLVLKIAEEGSITVIGQFNSFVELRGFLVKNTERYFGWINDNVNPEDYRQLPDFTDCKDVRDVRVVLSDYDYSWWSMQIEA